MRQPLYIGIVWIAAWCGIVSAAAKKPAYIVPDSLQVLTFRVGEQVVKMQRVEGGVFTMGATPEQQSDPVSSDRPMHTVAVSPFYIGTTEVTNALWQTVMPDWNKINEWEDPLKPVSWVSWDDCQVFIERLNALTNSHFRLLTEAEWEYAARGGERGHSYRFAGGNIADSVSWGLNNAGNQKHRVAQRQTNELGLYDMTGNVSEWCQDWFAPYYLGTEPNPQGPATGQLRVARGGSYDNCEDNRHLSVRFYHFPNRAMGDCGLRLALTLPDDPAQVVPEEPQLTRRVRISNRTFRMLYVPADKPYYISEKPVSFGQWRHIMHSDLEGKALRPATGMTREERTRFIETGRTESGQPLAIADLAEVDMAVALQVVSAKDTITMSVRDRKRQRSTQDIQRSRRVRRRANQWTELIGIHLDVPDDPVLQSFTHDNGDSLPLWLVIRQFP